MGEKKKIRKQQKNDKNLKEELFSYCFLSIFVLKKITCPCHIQDKSAVKKDAYSVRNPVQDTLSFQINSPLPRCYSKLKVISSVVFETNLYFLRKLCTRLPKARAKSRVKICAWPGGIRCARSFDVQENKNNPTATAVSGWEATHLSQRGIKTKQVMKTKRKKKQPANSNRIFCALNSNLLKLFEDCSQSTWKTRAKLRVKNHHNSKLSETSQCHLSVYFHKVSLPRYKFLSWKWYAWYNIWFEMIWMYTIEHYIKYNVYVV